MTREEQNEQINKELEEFYKERYKTWFKFHKETTDLSDKEIQDKLKKCTCVFPDEVKSLTYEKKQFLFKELKEGFEIWKTSKKI